MIVLMMIVKHVLLLVLNVWTLLPNVQLVLMDIISLEIPVFLVKMVVTPVIKPINVLLVQVPIEIP